MQQSIMKIKSQNADLTKIDKSSLLYRLSIYMYESHAKLPYVTKILDLSDEEVLYIQTAWHILNAVDNKYVQKL
jgi:hypothetical protein